MAQFLDEIFKANDIRAVVSADQVQLDPAGVHLLGQAFVELLDLAGGEFALGRDARRLGRELSLAFADGARSAGASVVDLGLTATDQLWFASGHLGIPGVQFTASHNPKQYNGMKFCRAGALPVSTSFTTQLRDRARAGGSDFAGPQGEYRELDVLPAYVAKLHDLAPMRGSRALRVVVDAGNGMAGITAPATLAARNVEMIGLYLDPDGEFPNHPPNPLEPENLRDAQAAVVAHQADLGLVFDGDADRCFIIDERGEVVDPSAVTALIALAELAKEPGGTVVINTITSSAVADAVAGNGHLVTTKVGHAYVKAAMAQHNAIFGGEHSAHYYFRDFYYADTGMLAGLHVLEMLRASEVPLSHLVARFAGYHRSGELNTQVSDQAACQQAVADAFADRGEISSGDGITVVNNDQQWWLNVRPSNTEPLLRLNVEARDAAQMHQLRDEVLALIAQGESDE